MRVLLRVRIVFVAAFLISCLVSADGQGARENSSSDTPRATPAADSAATTSASEITIPGPLRSFLRMAGVSQKASAEEVLPLVARNIYVQGYVGWSDGGTPTEFLTLLGRYVNQARELSALAGGERVIRVPGCEQSAPLLRILGYRLRGTCGDRNATLITSEAERAFLTTDSGFPLSALEEALQQGKPFSYAFPASHVPVLFSVGEWVSTTKGSGSESSDLIDALLRHPLVARLYWALSRDDAETRAFLEKSIGLKKLLPLSPVMDYYGSQVLIPDGRAQVPGGKAAERSWKDVVGASPESPADFATNLFTKDNQCLAAYYNSLARISS